MILCNVGLQASVGKPGPNSCATVQKRVIQVQCVMLVGIRYLVKGTELSIPLK